MADVNSNININFNTAAALAQLRSLQAGLSKFHQSLAEGNLAAANAQKGLNAQLLQSIGATGKFSASQVKVAGSTLAFTSALEKNKLSLREYYRYTMAAATANTRVMGKAFAQEREIINRARRDRVKALQSQYIQMNKANAGFMDAIRVMPKSLQMASGKFTELGTRIQYAAQRQQFLNQLLKQGSTQLLNFGKNTQWAGRQLMVGLTMPLALFGGMAAKTFKELETEIVKFRRVYGNAFTNDVEVNSAVENIRRLGNEYTKYGVSVTKTMEMAATAAAAGFQGNALSAQVETATKLAVLGQIEQQQALETTISLQSAFGISSEDLAKKIDFLNAVENQTLLSIEDLTIAIPKAAPVVKQLGGSVEDLAFFLTAMKEGGINASEGANALKSGLASLINPAEKSAKFLAELGINIKGIVEANAGDIKGTVVQFSQALDTLDPLNRARAIEQLFGKFQFSRLSTLFQNVTKEGSQASRALDLAGSSIEELAILSEREMKKIEESTGVKFQAALEQFKQEIMPLGKAFLEALTPVVKFFGSLFEKFNGLSDQTKKVVATIVGVVAGLGPIVLMTFGLLANGVANVIKFFAMLRGGIAKLNGQTSVMGASFNYMTQEQIESAAASQALHQTHTRLIEVFNVEKASVNALAGSYNSLSTQMRSMAAQNPALFAGGMGGARAAVSKLPPVRKYADGILSVPGPKGAGDVMPAMLSPGEAVIPTKTTEKYRGLITAMFQDKVPGFMAGRLPGGPGRGIPLSAGPAAVRKAQQEKYTRQSDARQGYDEPHPKKPNGPVFVGMPKTFKEASQSRQMLEKIAERTSLGVFGTMPPSNFGTKLQGFKGYSFPDTSIGGVYRKPNGKVVVVKPTVSAETALAEVRMAEIEAARGMIVPKQSIRTMIDPTDPTGQRKFIVLESPYDRRFVGMDGKFSKSEMVKQLVGSTLRGDKDLQKSNVSGNRVPDVSNAGVFDRASGLRDYAKVMPSMEEQAMINLLGVKGGARKDFALSTASIAAKMSPKEYNDAIKGEINRTIPIVERVMKSWDLTPDEQIVYGKMLDRLKAGAKVEWDQFQPIHARAGQGVIKASKGLLDGAGNSVVEEQMKKYLTGSDDVRTRQVADLSEGVEKAFASKVEELKKLGEAKVGGTSAENRARIVQAAWNGEVVPIPPSGKDKKWKARQTMFQNEIRSMIPINVDGVTKYLHPDDMESFKSDPDHRAKHARTRQEVIDNVLYRMGVAPNKDGVFVDKGGFKGRFGNKTEFAKDLRSSNKAAGGGINMTSKVVRPFAREEIKEFNQRVGNPLKTKTGQWMLANGWSDDEVKDRLKENLSHIKKEVTGSTSGADKMKTGKALYDARLLNNYLNADRRSSNILSWNGGPDGSQNILGLSDIEEYKKAAAFMEKEQHPQNPQERALLAKAVDLDQKVIEHQRRGNYVPSNLLIQDQRVPKALQMLLADPDIKPGRLIDLAAATPDKVFVNPGNEFKVNTKSGKESKLTDANTSKPPVNAKPSSGSIRDTKIASLGANETVATRRQLMNFRRGFANIPTFSMPGMIDGDPRLDPQSTRGGSSDQLSKAAQRRINAGLAQKARMLATENKLTQTQIQRAIERIRIQRTEAEVTRAKIHQEKQSLALAKKNAPAIRKAQIKEKRMARQQRIGGVSGGLAMGLGTAGMGLMMAGQQTAGMAAMGASAVAGLLPMFAGMGPFGLMMTAATAAGGALFLLNKNFEDAAKKQSEFANQTSATADKMKKIGEITGKVGATEIMNRRRSSTTFDSFSKGYDRAGQQFGTNFMASEVGKDISKGFGADLSLDRGTAVKKFALQLSQYVSDGVIDGVQAGDIARQLSVDFKDMSLYPSIIGQLTQLIGPDGSNLLKDPMKIRVLLTQEQTNVATTTAEGIETKGKVSSAKNLFTFNDNPAEAVKRNAAQAALTASMYVRALETNKSNIDATNVQYEKDKEVLKQKLLIAKTDEERSKIQDKINDLSRQNQVDNKILSKETSKTLLAQQKAYDKTSRSAQGLLPGQLNSTRNAFIIANKEQVRSRYAGTQLEKDVNPFLDRTAALNSTDLEIRINAIAGSGTNPMALVALMNMFGDNEQELKKQLDLGIKTRGADKTLAMMQGLGIVEDEEVRKELFLKINEISDDAQFADVASTLNKISEMEGKDFDINAYLKGNAFAKLKDLSERLRRFQDLPDPIEKTAISSIIEKSTNPDEKASLSAVVANWEYFETLPKEIRKTAVTTMITAYDMTGAEAIDAEIEKRLGKSKGSLRARLKASLNTPESRARIQSELALKATKPQYRTDGPKRDKNPPPPEDTITKEGNDPLKFLDSLAMRIKNVRDGAFDATKPLESMMAAFTSKKAQADASSMFDIFDGLQQRMMTLGVPKEFRDMISGMSEEDFTAFASLPKGKNMFTYDKYTSGKNKGKEKPRTKANIKGLTEDGKAVMQTYREAQAGEYQLVQQEIVQTIKDQNAAFNQLISTGMSTSDALNVVEDSALAAAIASGSVGKKGSPEFKEFTEDIKTANTELEKQAVLNRALKANEDFKFQENAVDFAKSFYDAGLSIDQIQEVLADPQLTAYLVEDLKDGKIEAGAIKDYIDSIPKRVKVDIEQKLSKNDFLGAAAPGLEIVDKMFQIQESLIVLNGKKTTKPIEDDIDKQEALILALQKEEKERISLKGILDDYTVSYDELLDKVKEYQKTIEDAQRDLEVNSDYGSRVIDELNENINDLNREIEMDPEWGTRAVQSLQDESGVLSNDLEVMNNAAEKINEEYDKQAEALQKVSDINQNIVDQQKEQIDLADALTQGDIASAARAAQQMRQTNVSQYAEGMSNALEQSRTNSIDGLTNSRGMNRKKIEERQFEIAQKIYAMENDPERVKKAQAIKDIQDSIYAKEELREKKLLEIQAIEDKMYAIQQEIAKDEGLLDKENKKLQDLNTKLSDAEKSIQKQLDNIKVMGKDKDGWDLVKTKLEAYNLALDKTVNEKMAGLTKATAAVEADWESINGWLNSWLGSDGSVINLETIHTITYVYSGDPGSGGVGGNSYVAPQDTPESLAAFEEFIEIVEELDAAQAAVDAAVQALEEGKKTGYSVIIRELEEDLSYKAGLLAAAQAEYDATLPKDDPESTGSGGSGGGKYGMAYQAKGGMIKPLYRPMGGLIPYFLNGGFAKGTDTVPAMLTPGEFVMSKYAVDSYGVDNLKLINSGQSPTGSVYNNTYALTVNAKTDASPNEIAQAVMSTIKQVDDRRIRGVSLNAR